MSVKVLRQISDEGKRFYEAVDLIGSRKVGKVGWFKSSKYANGTPVAEVAAKNEFGDPTNNQPPRPFMRSAIARFRGHWQKTAQKAAKDFLMGKADKPEHVLEVVGLVAADSIRTQINELQSPPLSPRTIAARQYKRARGKRLFAGVDKPLIESGIMLTTLTNAVEDE